MSDFTRVGSMTCTVGESPLWHAKEQAWYWVDINARTIWRHDPASGAVRSWHTDEMIACLAVKDSGGFIGGMESGIFALSLNDDGSVAENRLAAPAELAPGMRFNDGRCDRQGRFWSGTMLLDMAAARPDGKLYRYTAEGGISAPVVDDLIVQNGLAWSPDGRTMYLSDSHASRRLVWAYDYDLDDGVPSGRRLFADLHAHVGRPDGAAMDVDGGYWICANDAGALLRFAPDGKLDRRIDVPFKKPSMCAFGGAELKSMLVVSISAGAPQGDTLAGAAFIIDPGVQGMAEACFKG